MVLVYTESPVDDFWLATLDQDVLDYYARNVSLDLTWLERTDSELHIYSVGAKGTAFHTALRGALDLKQFRYHAEQNNYSMDSAYYDELVHLAVERVVVDNPRDVDDDHDSNDGDITICPSCTVPAPADQWLLCDTCNAEVHMACMEPPLPDHWRLSDLFLCDPTTKWTTCKVSAAPTRRKRIANKKYTDASD